MSNIGRKPIQISEAVKIQLQDGKVIASGPKGTLELTVPKGISVVLGDKNITVKKDMESKEYDKHFGLTRALIANTITGVEKGFEKKLELSGVGYRAKTEGDTLVLNVGFAVPVKIKIPQGITVKVDENIISVNGVNKEFVGNIASEIKKIRPPDPYKAKGIKYVGERIRRKAGKAAKTASAK